MGRLIDVEQAVEAVEAIESRWPGPLVAMIPKGDAIIALRALKPQEPWKGETPRWEHDMDCCTFLGRYNDCDLWGCDKSSESAYSIGGVVLMARYSDKPEDYTSNRPDPRVPEWEGLRRWRERRSRRDEEGVDDEAQ